MPLLKHFYATAEITVPIYFKSLNNSIKIKKIKPYTRAEFEAVRLSRTLDSE